MLTTGQQCLFLCDIFAGGCFICSSVANQHHSCSNIQVFELLCCCVLCLVTESCPALCDPMDYSPPGSSVHGNSPGKNIGVGCHSLLQGIFPTQGSNPGLQHCRQNSLPTEPPGKPKNTGVGSLSLLHGYFPIQKLNQGLLYCRGILYQLSYQGNHFE